MPRTVDQSSPPALPVPSSFRWKLPLLPIFATAVGVLLALWLWTLPTWGAFAGNVAHFPALWQAASNRHTIIVLVLKVASPILLGLLIGACCWLWSTLQSVLGTEEDTHAENVGTTRASRTAQAKSEAARPQHGQPPTLPSTPVASTPAFPSLPTTPRPPTLTHVTAQRGWQAPASGEADKHSRGGSRSRKLSPHAAALLRRRKLRLSGDVDAREEHDGPRDAPAAFSLDAEDVETSADVTPLPSPSPVSLCLLKEVVLRLHAPNGMSRVVPLSLNAKRVQLLAYVGCRRGEAVKRDSILEYVFGHGRSDEEASPEKLGEAFDSHKKLLRADLREAVARLNAEAGQEVLAPDLDIFAHQRQMWWLSPLCRVTDLEAIEAQHRIIEEARSQGALVNEVPEQVKAACDTLIATYTGDFLADLIRDYSDAFEPWANSWVRRPLTLYRDYYLQALWYAAEYEWRKGQCVTHGQAEQEGEERRKQQREHWGRAAQLYRMYAMHACNSRLDTKVTFGGNGREHGERVVMSERALRRSVVLYGAIGSTHVVDEVYSAYSRHMRLLSSKVWEPSKETLADVRAAKEQTSAYRFLAQVAQPESAAQQAGGADRT